MSARPAAPSRKPPTNNALRRPMQPSAELAAVIGAGLVSRTEATAKLWAYIRDQRCQSQEDRRTIVADAKLRPVFGGAGTASMFEIPKHLNRHLTAPS